MSINSVSAAYSASRKLAAASSLPALFPDEKLRNVQPTAQVFVYIMRNNILSLRQEVSAALIRITGIYYTQQSPFSELFDNRLSLTKAFSTHWRGFMNLGAYIAYRFACKVPAGHGSWKSLSTESTEDSLNVDGELGYAIQWPSPETDIVCPVIALCLYLWSQPPLGMTSHLKGRDRGDIYRPITAQSVKLYQLVTAPCPTLLSFLLWKEGKKSTGPEPIPNCRVTNVHTNTHTEAHVHTKSEGKQRDLDLPIPLKSFNAGSK